MAEEVVNKLESVCAMYLSEKTKPRTSHFCGPSMYKDQKSDADSTKQYPGILGRKRGPPKVPKYQKQMEEAANVS